MDLIVLDLNWIMNCTKINKFVTLPNFKFIIPALTLISISFKNVLPTSLNINCFRICLYIILWSSIKNIFKIIPNEEEHLNKNQSIQYYLCCSASNPRQMTWATSTSDGHGSAAIQPNTPHSWRNCLSSSSTDIPTLKQNKITLKI